MRGFFFNSEQTAFFRQRTPRRCLLRGRLSLNLSHSVTQGKANAFTALFLKWTCPLSVIHKFVLIEMHTCRCLNWIRCWSSCVIWDQSSRSVPTVWSEERESEITEEEGRNGTQQGDLSYFERFEQSSGATKPDSLIIFKFISIHFVTFLWNCLQRSVSSLADWIWTPEKLISCASLNGTQN